MHEVLSSVRFPTPVRALLTDDPEEILGLAAEQFQKGVDVALATLIEIRGGAARPLGSHMVVTADGHFCGYVSGGCVEAAVAAEALLAMATGRDRTVMFGAGSPFMDIVLPCGGGISVAIHLLRDVEPLLHVLDCLDCRQLSALRYAPEREALQVAQPPERSCLREGEFLTVYRPRTRLVISGQSIEAQTVARLAKASGYDVIQPHPGQGAAQLASCIDPFTAIVILHHDLDQEDAVLEAALKSCGFYVGALGSTRTHRLRVDRLKALGYTHSELQRVKAPIGVFGPAKDSSSLALSVLADIAASRLTFWA